MSGNVKEVYVSGSIATDDGKMVSYDPNKGVIMTLHNNPGLEIE